MRKNIIKYLFSLLFLFYKFSYSSPLEIGNNVYGQPFLIYNNPSLICKQIGVPIGTSLYYNTSSKEYNLITGFIEKFSNSGFSLCYVKRNYKYFDKLSTAFSTLYKKISFGSSFHFIFSDSKALFTMDLGGSYHFKERRYISTIFKNVFNVDTTNDILSRELIISTGGDFPWLKKMDYTVQGIIDIYDYDIKECGYGGNINIHKFFFNNPSLSVYSNGKVFYTREKIKEWAIEVIAGYHHIFNTFLFGIYAGFEYPSEIKNSRLSFSFYVNPLYKKERPSLSCEIQLTSSKLTPNGDGINDNIIIDIKGIFSSKNIKAKRWSLFISKDRLSESDVLRTFSGGNIPPSSLLWDGRDNKGELLKNGAYYIRLILIDTLNRVVSSSYKKVTIF